jgi:hypothetical protein
MSAEVIFMILWWSGAVTCLANGIWAFIAPIHWSRFAQHHGGLWRVLLGRTALIRALGAAGIIIGCLWIVQGF